MGFGSKGQKEKTVAFLSTLDEEHIQEDSLWVESLRGLVVDIVLWDVVWGGAVLRCLFLVYFVYTRSALRCYL